MVAGEIKLPSALLQFVRRSGWLSSSRTRVNLVVGASFSSATAGGMIDCGGARMLGPTAGRMPQALQQLGIDPGQVDEVYITHMHGDHVGNVHNKAPNSGSCEKPDTSVSALPNTAAVSIALAKNSKIVTGSEMPPFFAGKLKANGGDPKDSILARFGGSVKVGGVTIATVNALHSNGLDPDYIGGDLGKNMKESLAKIEWGSNAAGG